MLKKNFKKLKHTARVYVDRSKDLKKRKLKKLSRIFNKANGSQGYYFAILTVKKKIYIELAINNINSLHFINPSHRFIIYCDDVCFAEFYKKRKRLDYPGQVKAVNSYRNGGMPWQYYKIETLIEASKNGLILTDADGIWHHDPQISKDKMTLLVIAHQFKHNENEKKLITQYFKKDEWSDFYHYVTGFVSIPPKFMNDKLAEDLRKLNKMILECPFDFISEQDKKEDMRRLSEELAVSFAIQINYPNDIFTLKTEDGPKNKNILQSMYYGCANRIIN